MSWHWLFLPSVPIGILGSLLGRKLLIETPRRESKPLDVTGLLVGSSGLALAIFALAQSRRWGLTDTRTIAVLCTGLALLAVFAWHVLRAANTAPLLELRLTRTKLYSASLVTIGLVTLPQYSRALFIPLQLSEARGFSTLKIGLVLTPAAVATAISMGIGGRLVDRMGARNPALLGITLMFAGCVGSSFNGLSTPMWTVAMWLTVQGLGVGLVMIPTAVVGLNALADRAMAQGSTLRSLTNQVAAAISVAVLFAYLNPRVNATSSAASRQHAYNGAFRISAVVLVLAAFAVARMPTRERP